MIYLFEVYAALAAVVFLAAGLIVLGFFVVAEAQEHLPNFANSLARSFANSRTFSRVAVRVPLTPRKIQ